MIIHEFEVPFLLVMGWITEYAELDNPRREAVVEHTHEGCVYRFKIGPRLRTYYKGVVCVGCGVEGNVFYADRLHTTKPGSVHLNLYHRDGDDLLLMTSDHIVPLCMGGASSALKNRQPMCVVCNNKKGPNLVS